MKSKKSKGFTLIELIAVLVIMAIIALIVTPLVMSIIKKARISADKRSIDAYGRSVELAIAGYLLDTGDFPTDINQLTIEYSGDEVVCTTQQLNSDSSIYLAGCTVDGRSVDGYTYGKEETVSYDAYEVGDEVTYNNVNYYVIKDSSASESTVTLLKAEPLSVDEVNQFGAGHVNMNVPSSASCYQTACDNSYGGMQYYSSSTCGYNGTDWVYDGCKNDYASSEVKYVVDAWKASKAPAADEARLLTYEEASEYAEAKQICTGSCYEAMGLKYDWMYNNNYWYWLGTPYTDSSSDVWLVNSDGALGVSSLRTSRYGVVRPVITISKSAL